MRSMHPTPRPAALLLFTMVLPMWELLMPAQTPSSELHLQINDPSGMAMEAQGQLQSAKLSNAPGTLNRTFHTDPQGRFFHDACILSRSPSTNQVVLHALANPLDFTGRGH